MYLVVIGWLYVVLMMAVAEASNTTGTILGAIVTFFLYGLMPVTLVVYLMRTPQRRKEMKAREAAERAALQSDDAAPDSPATPSVDPDTGGHATGSDTSSAVAAVRKEARIGHGTETAAVNSGYTTSRQTAEIGSLELSVKETEQFSVPAWLGWMLIASGCCLLLIPRRS